MSTSTTLHVTLVQAVKNPATDALSKWVGSSKTGGYDQEFEQAATAAKSATLTVAATYGTNIDLTVDPLLAGEVATYTFHIIEVVEAIRTNQEIRIQFPKEYYDYYVMPAKKRSDATDADGMDVYDVACVVSVDGSVDTGADCTSVLNSVRVKLSSDVAVAANVTIDLVGVVNPDVSQPTFNVFVMDYNNSDGYTYENRDQALYYF